MDAIPAISRYADLLDSLLNDASWTDRDLTQILNHQLSVPLPPATLLSPQSPSIGDLLRNATTSLDDLKRVKDFAKAVRASSGGALPTPVATIIYYAALATSLTRYGVSLSELPVDSQRNGFAWLAQCNFAPADLRDLGTTAVRATDSLISVSNPTPRL